MKCSKNHLFDVVQLEKFMINTSINLDINTRWINRKIRLSGKALLDDLHKTYVLEMWTELISKQTDKYKYSMKIKKSPLHLKLVLNLSNRIKNFKSDLSEKKKKIRNLILRLTEDDINSREDQKFHFYLRKMFKQNEDFMPVFKLKQV